MADIRFLEKQCKALAQWRRIRLLAFLKKNRKAIVGDIAKELGCSIQATSQHLRLLRNAGIILDRRQKKTVEYVLAEKMSPIAETMIKGL
ncbi:winged helix-turn-helix transcriptional regulator [Candidatus Peregrinibacteria bacterium]|nr:winged helix-turn-helix transcriptional regulator [Candidatus Peregrinibacteria bacterium]